MIEEPEIRSRLFLPVRRVLACMTLAYVAGVCLAGSAILPVHVSGAICAFLLGWAALRRRRRKGAFLLLFFALLLLGNLRAGCHLQMPDLPSRPGAAVCGRVSAIVRQGRVRLTDVVVDGGEPLKRDAVVTLMLEEDQAMTPVAVGQTVSGKGRLFAQDEVRNPGGVDRRISALVDGYELSGYLLPGWTAHGESRFSLRELFRVQREAIVARLETIFGERAALFQGVMLGDKSAMDQQVVSAMRLTGTAHILTVSGMHLGMIADVFSRLLRKARMGGSLRLLLLALLLGWFTGLTGCAAGTVRAYIMAMMRELARVRGRRYEPLTALSAAALIMAAVHPLWPLDASFRFSFFVVLGIQLMASRLTGCLRRISLPRMLQKPMQGAAISAAAQLAACPMQLLLYGYIPLLSLPMNLFCAMWLPFLLFGGWICAALSVIPCIGAWPAQLLGWFCHVFEQLSVYAASLPFAVVRIPSPYAYTLLPVFFLMCLVSDRMLFGPRRRAAARMLAAALVLSYAVRFCPAPRYVQLDVGQGDAALLRRGRHAVLVDVGPSDRYDMLRYLRHEGLVVDAVVLSHLDEDHAGALGVLLNSEVEIPRVIMPAESGGRTLAPEVESALLQLRDMQIPVDFVSAGDEIVAGGWAFDVLSPHDGLTGSNERSLLLHVIEEDVSFLLAGDLPKDSEPDDVPPCDVLKVAHHGSCGATSDAFLRSADPAISLISVGGNNRYGHPSDKVLDALGAMGSSVLRTDEHGCITLWLWRGRASVQCQFPDAE